MKGRITTTGYRRNSPDVRNDFNIIPSNRISMKGVDFPVLGIDNLGNTQLMHPGGEYEYQGDYVTELPMYGSGGLTQWFAEEWVDIKTGKKCGRSGKDKKGRPYPACRPSKRVNKTTPKTRGEMSAAEKAKFKRKKKSGKRIDYNHKRELGGALDMYQTKGETPLTRKEVFNVPRTMAYEDGKMVVQDKPIWDGFLDETTVTASRLPSPEFNLGPQATISQYTPPSNREYLLNKLENPMTALGYILGGKDMPNKIGRENAFDYAVDVINPLAYVNTLGDIYDSVSEGDIIGAGINAITLAPIVPTAVKQGKNLFKRSVQVGNKFVTPLSYKRVYQFNPFANQRPPFTTVVRTQMPGQTGKLVMGQYYDDLANQGKKLNWRQNLDRNSSRRFGYGRGFSSDAADIMNYSHPSFTAFRGYDPSVITPELLVKRLPTSYLDDFMVANLSPSAQKAYGSGKKFSEFVLPIDDVLSAETRAFSKEAYDEIRNIRNAELTPHWFKGFQEVKALGGSIPKAQFGGRPGDVFQEVDTYIKPGQRIRPNWTHSPVSVTNYTFGKTLLDDEPRFSLSLQGTDILDEIKYRADAIGSVGIGVGNRKGKSFRPAGENLRAGIRGQASWQGVPGNVIENMFGRRSGLDWRGSFEGEAGLAYANGAVRPYMSVMPQTNIFLNDNLSLGIGMEMRGRYDRNFDEPVYGNTDTGSIAPITQRDAYSGMGRGAARFSLNYDLGNGDFIEGYYAKPDPFYQGSMPGIREMLALESEQPRFGVRLRKSFAEGGQLPSYQTRGEVPNKILNWQDDKEWFNNRAVFSDNADYNDLIKKLTLAGTHGFNPATGVLHKLDTPVTVDPDIAYNVNKGTVENKRKNSNLELTQSEDVVPVQISNEDWWNPNFNFKTPGGTANARNFAGQTVYMSPQEAEAYNREMVRGNMERVHNDSYLWRAPGLAYTSIFTPNALIPESAVYTSSNLYQGNYGAAALSTLGVIPSFSRVKNLGPTFNLNKGTPIKSSFNLVKTAAPVSKPATLISGRLPKGVKNWVSSLDQGQVPEYIVGVERGVRDVLGIGVPRRPFFETFPMTRSQRLKVQGLQDQAALEAEAFVKAYTHDGTQLQPWVVSKLQDWAPGATWQTNLRNQPHLRNKRVVLTDTRPGRRSSLLTDANQEYINSNRINLSGFATMGTPSNMVTFRNQGWYFHRPSQVADVVAHEGAHGLPQSILDIHGRPLGDYMSKWNTNVNYFANPAYNPTWASNVTEAHNVTKKFTPNPFKNPERSWAAAPIEFDAEKLAARFRLYKNWQSKGANMSPETFLRLESESINPFRLNKIPGMGGPIGFDPEAFQAYYKGQLSGHLINPNMPVREFNTMNKFYRRGGQLPTYQTKGETPLTRDEIFNIPRTIRYENSDMVVQDKPIWDGMLNEVTVTPTTASEYAWQENRANQSTGGLEPVYPIFDLMSSGLRAPLTKGAKAVQGALTSEKTLGALTRSPYIPKFTKPGLIKNYKSKFPNVDLRGTGTGNYSKLGVNELGLGVDDLGSLTNYERSAISQVNQTQPADEVFNTFVQRYADFNTDDALANQLADFSRRNPRTKFEMNLGRDVTPSKRMQEIFDDPELNVHNVFSYESSGPMNFVNKWGNESRRFYDSSARDAAGEFEKNLRSYGQQGFYAANVPMGKPLKQALTYNKDGRVFDYVKETLPVSDFVVNKGLMNPDVIGNFSRYRGAGDMANQHNFLLGITNSPSVIISGNKGFAGLKGGNKIREKIGGLITPTGGKAVSSHNKQVVPLLKQEFNLSKPFEGTFMKSPSILETYYNSRGQASPYTNFPGILDIDDLFITGKSNLAKGGQLPKAQLGNGEKHTVESGETFYGIANQNGIAWEDLVSANPGIDIEKLSVGQIINIPSVSKSGGVKITYSDPELNILQQEKELGNIKQSEPEQVEEVKITKQPVETKTTQVYDGPGYFPEALLLKQAYKESTFNPAAQSKIKDPAQGFAQFRPITVRELQRLGFADDTFDPFDYTQSIGAQRDYMNYLYTRPWIDKPNQSEEVRLAKTLAAYNWGPEVFKTFLTNKKAAGVDIYNSLDWVDQLPGETGDYINKILLDSDEQFQADYQKALKDTANLKYINLYNLKAGGESLPTFDDYDTFDRAWLAARKKLGRGKQFMYGGKVRSTDT